MPVLFAVTVALFNLNAHSGTVFSHSYEKIVHLMGYCHIHPLKVNRLRISEHNILCPEWISSARIRLVPNF